MKRLRAIITVGGAILVGACGESSLAPSSATSDSGAQAADATIRGGGASAMLSAWDTLRFSFVIDPARSITYPLGFGNSITFPAGSLCDVSSTYGPGQWDAPCAVATHPLTVHAKAWIDSQGHPRIDFDQHIRFAPSADSHGWVVITLRDSRAALKYGSIIGYCPSAASDCIDESLTDPSLATVKDPVTGALTRRIKHFSGYNVFAGRVADGDSYSAWNRMAPGQGLQLAPPSSSSRRRTQKAAKRGGYMLAWG